MDFQHVPVGVDEVLALLHPIPGGIYCDATVGGGGHAEKVLEASAPDGRLVGIDRDPVAVRAAKAHLKRFGDRVQIFQGRFSDLEVLLERAGVAAIDGLLVDLGVSSHQLDVAERGFSFMKLGPLDMRMNQGEGESAGGLLSRTTEDELADLIYRFGGERLSRPVAHSIKQMERRGRLNTTRDLAVAVSRVVKRRSSGIDPCTRTFQAIRIAVNDEGGELTRLLDLLPGPLALGGRVVVISFHSLEDGMVKQRFKSLAQPCVCPPGMPECRCPEPQVSYVTRRAVRVGRTESQANPRARSAKIRAVRRIR
jgi:16S rRNA (cytosine1402-N4)-methyltransferase